MKRLGTRSPEPRLAPAVLWFTGLPSAGKTSIARRVASDLRRRGYLVEELDGDAIREVFPQTGFTRPEREEHVMRTGYLASRLEHHGVFVLASLVSPYEASRRFVRTLCKRFIEIYVATPLAECERRDVKGLYARARRGDIRNFTGVDDAYEPPLRPELTLRTEDSTPDAAAQTVMGWIERHLARPGGAATGK